ncbi:hypothetical protein [Consotaella aegiceratis]|uniref:hypothetical protein n=1 Tax=Consotaella aegiceratis TaxID=3097961 RepID=UPI002F3ECF7B
MAMVFLLDDVDAARLEASAGAARHLQIKPSDDASRWLDMLLSDVGTRRSCSRRRATAEYDLQLQRLDTIMTSPTVSLDALDAASAATLDAGRVLLRCFPTDGEAWLLQANLETRLVGPAAPAIQKMKLSAWTTPNEGAVIHRRIGVAARLFSAGVDEIRDVLAGDLLVLFNWGRRQDIQRIADRMHGIGSVLSAIDVSPEEPWRRELLVSMLGREGRVVQSNDDRLPQD